MRRLITLILFVAIFLFVLWAQSRQGGHPFREGRIRAVAAMAAARFSFPETGREAVLADAAVEAAAGRAAGGTSAAAARQAIGRERLC